MATRWLDWLFVALFLVSTDLRRVGGDEQTEETAATAQTFKCDPDICDCAQSGVTYPNIAEMKSFVTSMDGTGGLQVSYQAPVSFWGTDGRKAPLLDTRANRMKVAYGLDLGEAGILMTAACMAGEYASTRRLAHAIGMQGGFNTLNTTVLRANGPTYYYGESSHTFITNKTSKGTLKDIIFNGYLFNWISARETWPDPIDLAPGGVCEGRFWECPFYKFSTGEPVDSAASAATAAASARQGRVASAAAPSFATAPSLRASVWGGLLGPMRRDYTEFVLTLAISMPVTSASMIILEHTLPALEQSAATVGGVYEYPVRTSQETPLVINVESNLLLKAALQMAQDIIAATAIPSAGLSLRVSGIADGVKELFAVAVSANETTSTGFNMGLGVFRTSITVPNPKTSPSTKVLTDDWDPATQITAISIMGTSMDPMYTPLHADATEPVAFNVWKKTLEVYGVYFNEVLIGLSFTEHGTVVDAELTMRAVSAGELIAVAYATHNLDISHQILNDVDGLMGRKPRYQGGGFLRSGCAVLSNVTAFSAFYPLHLPARYGFVDTAIPTVAMTAASWGLIASTTTASPYTLSPPRPRPPAPGPESKSLTISSTVLLILGSLCGLAVLTALTAKGIAMQKRRANYAEMENAYEQNDVRGEDLGFF
eukprot:Rhum_TRINITY_DN14390_c18_g1::Rhum_TRINITY_DN14390_c18_g1_i1::g.85781::m.85781